MRILDRYILKEVALHFFAVTGVLAVILVSLRTAKVLDIAASNQFPRDVVWSLVGLMSVAELTVLMPVGLFLAVMLALGRLYHDSEMAALQACGVGVRQLYGPILWLAGLVATVLLWLTLLVVPNIYARVQHVKVQALREARLANLAPKHFGSFAGGDLIYYAESIDAKGVLYNVFVQRRRGDRVQITVAKRAEQRGAGEVDQTFVLYDGEQYEGVPGRGRMRIAKFAELGYPIHLPMDATSALRADSRPTLELWRSDRGEDRSELHQRIAVPLMTVILAVLAVPLARLRPRQGRYAKMGLALLAYFAYQVGIATSSVWIAKDTPQGLLGMWWLHALALGVALWLLFRQDPWRGKRAASQGAAP